MTDTATSALEVGAIFSSSWGYDQTNVDFYKLVRVSPSGVFGTFEKIKACPVEQVGGGARLVPLDVAVGKQFRRKLHLSPYSGEWGFSVCSYAWASEWDGVARYDTLAAGEAGH